MTMQNSASLRREKQLQDLLDGKHFKQALTLCEKSLKKGDKSEQLLITKVNILLAHPEQARRQQGQKELDEILGRHHPISEIEALTALNDAAHDRKDKDARIQTIWERAAGVRPQDEEFYVRWFKIKFSERKWNAAQKAAMMYMKRFPDKREPFFWNIITCELAGTDENSSEMDRKILRPLAYGFLSKAAADVPAKKTARNHGRALNTLEDLLLLLKIFRSQERYVEALKILDDSRTGVNSRLGQNSWELVRHKIDLYELCHRWDEEWKFCRELLEDAHPDNVQNASRSPYHHFGAFGDDWIVWAGFLSATAMINTTENSRLTEQLTETYIKSNKVSRNARLALVRYSVASLENETAQEKLVSVCYEYFLQYSASSSCYRDLQPYVSRLKSHFQGKLTRSVARYTRGLALDEKATQSKMLKWITSEINVLRLDYHLIVSREGSTDTSVPLFRAFVRSCIRLYKVSLLINITLPVSERHPGDDAAILAVMGLIRLYEFGERHAQLQSIAVLEFLISNSKHNYDALLILIRLYMRLGAGSLAIQLHSRLSIKNLQYATISWVLFTRISSIHPYATSTRNPIQTPIDSVKNLSIAIDWHKSAEISSGASVNRMLDNGQYSMLFETLGVDRAIKAGFAKFMFIIESHRIGRFSQFSKMKDYSNLLDEVPLKTEDTRDVTAFPDAEAANQPLFHEYLEPCTHQINDTWLGMEIRTIELWKFLQTKSGDLSGTPGTLMMEHNRSEPGSLTVMECEMAAVIDMLRIICDIYHCKPLKNDRFGEIQDAVKGLLQDLDDWQFTMVDSWKSEMQTNSRCLDWEYFHVVFLLLDLNQLTVHTLDYVLAENSKHRIIDQGDLESTSIHIRKSINELCVNINRVTSEKLDAFSIPGVADKMIEDAFGQPEDGEDVIGVDLKGLIGIPRLQEMARDICSSWREALEGIIRTKVR